MSTDVYEFREELALLKLKVIELEARISAAEAKQQRDHDGLLQEWRNVTTAIGANARAVENLRSQQAASTMALVHLMAITARQVNVPDADLKEAIKAIRMTLPQD